MATRATAGGVGKRELPRGRGPEMDQFGEQRTESEHEQNHITAIVANMELEVGLVTSETGRTRLQHSLLYVYRTEALTVERIIMLSFVLILADAKIRHWVNHCRVRRSSTSK